jgi:hypothetical protein
MKRHILSSRGQRQCISPAMTTQGFHPSGLADDITQLLRVQYASSKILRKKTGKMVCGIISRNKKWKREGSGKAGNRFGRFGRLILLFTATFTNPFEIKIHIFYTAMEIPGQQRFYIPVHVQIKNSPALSAAEVSVQARISVETGILRINSDVYCRSVFDEKFQGIIHGCF